MLNKRSIPVHETAFMIASFRATYPEWSKDVYAHLWNNSKTDKGVKTYLDEVSSEEVYAHCWRNRFFMDTIERLAKQNKIDALINFGAGFSMYPYLISAPLIHIEIDRPEIIEYKTEKIKKWQEKERLPIQEVHSIAVDFSEDYQTVLKNKIEHILNGKRCFILIEGVLYFLSPQVAQQLFEFFDTIQELGDYIGSGSFQEVLKEDIVFSKLYDYFEKYFTEEKNYYQMLNDEFYWNIQNYTIEERQDYFSLSVLYNHSPRLAREEILNESFYILKKWM